MSLLFGCESLHRSHVVFTIYVERRSEGDAEVAPAHLLRAMPAHANALLLVLPTAPHRAKLCAPSCTL